MFFVNLLISFHSDIREELDDIRDLLKQTKEELVATKKKLGENSRNTSLAANKTVPPLAEKVCWFQLFDMLEYE